MTTSTLRISLIQTDLVWEDKKSNLNAIRANLDKISGHSDVAILPEMCTTAFSVNATLLAESMCEETIHQLLEWADEFNIALVGSFICKEQDLFYNRAFVITPDGQTFYADKRHLFSLAGEDKYFSPGSKRNIIHYRGWNILPLVCYDLRFPVWSRNGLLSPTDRLGYDLLIYVANWPAARRSTWDILLPARSVENQCYTCGVNRIGIDYKGILYNGGTSAFDFKGNLLAKAPDNTEEIISVDLSLDSLQRYRQRFPFYHENDCFSFTT